MTLFSRKNFLYLAIFGLLIFSFSATVPAKADPFTNCSTQSAIPQAQCEALEDLYEDTGGDFWNTRTNWMQTDNPCEWYGVTCSSGTSGNVTDIMLEYNHLIGPIPATIGNLTSLGGFSLAGNGITGSIPSELGTITTLVNIDLSTNNLTGSIPTSFSGLTNLVWLTLFDNDLSGSIPTELGSMSSLEYLRIGDNNFTGSLPSELASITGLIELNVNNNQLSGEIPAELGGFSSLIYFYVGGNQFSGEIPAALGSLSTVWYMSLNQNQFTGSIPTAFSGLTSLRRLDLSSNQLTGSIPAGLSNATYIEDLRLSSNQISGSLPSSLRDLDNMTHFFVDNNQLTGNIPDEYGDLDSLNYLTLNNNQFSGVLNDVLTSTPLEYLYYQNTNFCTPQDSAFQTWLAGLTDYTDSGTDCPGKAILQSPDGKIFEHDPTFVWTEASDTVDYRVYITGSEGVVYNTWHSGATLCSSGSCSFTRGDELTIGTYTWMIQTRNSATAGPWSDGLQFRVSGAEPVSPSGTITDVTPEYTWDEFAGADTYRLFVSHAAVGTVVNEWYVGSLVCMAGTCTGENHTHLRTGNHSWTFQARNEDRSIDEWATWQTFKLLNTTPPSDPVVVVGPTGGSFTITSPTYEWFPVQRASWYKVFIGSQETGKVYNSYHRASEICYAYSCELEPTEYLLHGSPVSSLEDLTLHNWYVMPLNTGGNGAWSPAQTFNTCNWCVDPFSEE